MWDVLSGGNRTGGRGMLSCTFNKGKCPRNEGDMGDGTEQMRAAYITACACCGFVLFREKGKEITREESVCTYFQNVCVCVFYNFAYAVALPACYTFIKKK